jgi:polyhydroxybutyrate depolymerase
MKRYFYILVILILTTELTFGQSIVIDSLEHQSFQRKYTIHQPQGFDNTSPTPVVLMLHGGGGTMQNAQPFTELNNTSNANGFLAVYPQGHTPVQNGFSWADGRGTAADNAGIDDIGFINKLLDVLESGYSADPERIYICGFSNGGFMTQRLACQSNERFAAMASLGSIMDTMLISNCNPNRPKPMLLLLGTADPFVPYNGGEMIGSGNVTPIVGMDTLVDFWKTNNGCTTANPPINLPDINTNDNSTVTVFEYTDCDCDNSIVKFYRINGGGHTWPGVPNPIYEIIAGPTNQDIHASDEIWDFFSQFELCNLVTGIHDLEEQERILIYPNPSSNILFIETKSNSTIHYQITNLKGQEVKKGEYKNGINVTELTSGIYILTVKQENKITNRKIIKE